MTSISDRIRSRIEYHGRHQQIEQLCLDDIQIHSFSPAIKAQLERCVNLGYLSFNHCDLQSLENFPVLPSLICIQLQGNEIKNDDIAHLLNCKGLSHIMLDDNQIDSIESLRCLQALEDLEHLQVKGNPVCEIENYREAIFTMLEKLQMVDCRDRQGNIDALYDTQDRSEYLSDYSFGEERDLPSSQSQREKEDSDEEDDDEGEEIRKYRKY